MAKIEANSWESRDPKIRVVLSPVSGGGCARLSLGTCADEMKTWRESGLGRRTEGAGSRRANGSGSALFLPADGAGLAREGQAIGVGGLPASIHACSDACRELDTAVRADEYESIYLYFSTGSACPCSHVHKHLLFYLKLWTTKSRQRSSTHLWLPSISPELVQCHCLQLSKGLFSSLVFLLSLSQYQHERWICSCQQIKPCELRITRFQRWKNRDRVEIEKHYFPA